MLFNMKTAQVREMLNEKFDTLSQRNGIFTVKKSYFWGISKNGEEQAETVKSLIPQAMIIDYGNHFHGFVGGAPAGSPNSSYYYVKFTIED